jgi:hypothetical protein
MGRDLDQGATKFRQPNGKVKMEECSLWTGQFSKKIWLPLAFWHGTPATAITLPPLSVVIGSAAMKLL